MSPALKVVGYNKLYSAAGDNQNYREVRILLYHKITANDRDILPGEIISGRFFRVEEDQNERITQNGN